MDLISDEKKDNKAKRSRQFPIRKTPELINILLKDKTTNKNIIWGTDNYIGMGKDFLPQSQMKEKWITNGGNRLVQPRMKKHTKTQSIRTRENAEVFTPIWIVKKQNDLVEEELKNHSLDDYVSKVWLEITCGEAPYMCTRYDAVSGEPIQLLNRVGFVDRKFQRISKEIDDYNDWINYAIKAIKSSYGYELQGDSLLIARENILYTFIDYYKDKFKIIPELALMKEIATIISYNVFQMDGLKYIIPFSEEIQLRHRDLQLSLFDDYTEQEEIEVITEGTKVLIKDWLNNKNIDFERIILGGNNMKFDVVIGNPPYQENDNGKRIDGVVNASASPLYHKFVESAVEIGDVQSLIIPARWITGAGKGLGKFSEKMIRSKNIRYFSYFANSKDVFPDNEITGGICYFVKDNNYVGKTNIAAHFKTSYEHSTRVFDEHNAGVFIPFKLLSDILLKVKKINVLEEMNMQQLVSVLRPYGLRTDFFRDPAKYNLPKIQKRKNNNNDIEIFGLNRSKRMSVFVPENYPIPRGEDMIDSYKVFLPYAYGGDGMLGESEAVTMLGQPLVGGPNQICTETYLNIGKFKTEFEAESLYKYIKSKFFRVLVGILKSTQHATRTFRLVPLQDFTPKSDIDWGVSISDIDKQLYKKYGLSQEEIDFIEKNIKEMV